MLASSRALTLAVAILFSPVAHAADLYVMSSGGFTAALRQLAPVCERKTGDRIHIALGPSMATAPEAIPNRPTRGENAHLLIVVGHALDALVTSGVPKTANEPGSARALLEFPASAEARPTVAATGLDPKAR